MVACAARTKGLDQSRKRASNSLNFMARILRVGARRSYSRTENRELATGLTLAGTRRPGKAKPVCYPCDVRQIHTDRKSTRLNSSHSQISYAVFCLKKKKKKNAKNTPITSNARQQTYNSVS